MAYGQTILPRANEVGIDARMFVTAFALAACTTALFGILPALHLSRTNHLRAMGSRLPAAVINQSVVRQLFGDTNPVGSYLNWHGGRGDPLQVTVVGVVEDVRQGSIERAPYMDPMVALRTD